MARELTIQIRLTEEEHATIASQAKREGLGVGTYLRALASAPHSRHPLRRADEPSAHCAKSRSTRRHAVSTSFRRRRSTLLFDERVLEEYREVLSRPRFAIPPFQVEEVLRQLEAGGEPVATAPAEMTLPDPDDRAFVEACRLR